MSSSITKTQAETFTIADAKYLASRISHALNFMRVWCGQIDEEKVQKLTVEAAILLKFGLLDNVKYGYEKDGEWVYGVSFYADSYGNISSSDDNPSILDIPSDLDSATWVSFLTRKSNPQLDSADIAKINELIPIKRHAATEPGSSNGNWQYDNYYSKNGVGIKRQQFRRY